MRFCDSCLRGIPALSGALCRRCGAQFPSPRDPGHLCSHCMDRALYFRRARACATYFATEEKAGPLEKVLHRYKYGRDLSLAIVLGKVLADRCPFPADGYDLIVPVPLHLERLRWRGFNQAQLLAAELARRCRLRLNPFALERVRPTVPQVGLDAAARRRNVVGAFRVGDRTGIARRRVLLVDDVYTSGSTTNECSRALRRAGAEVVDVLVLARAALS